VCVLICCFIIFKSSTSYFSMAVPMHPVKLQIIKMHTAVISKSVLSLSVMPRNSFGILKHAHRHYCGLVFSQYRELKSRDTINRQHKNSNQDNNEAISEFLTILHQQNQQNKTKDHKSSKGKQPRVYSQTSCAPWQCWCPLLSGHWWRAAIVAVTQSLPVWPWGGPACARSCCHAHSLS